MQSVAIGAAMTALSLVLIRYAKRHGEAGERFWRGAVESPWMALVFTALFGLGVVAVLGGAMDIAGG